MQEISYKKLKFNPFNLIGDEWMLITAGDEMSMWFFNNIKTIVTYEKNFISICSTARIDSLQQ